MKYQRVYTEFWPDTRRWPEDERQLAIYLLTCEQRRMEGLFRHRIAYMADDLGWPADRSGQALEALIARGWCRYDGEWLLLVNSLRWDQPGAGNQTKGAAKAVEPAPIDSELYREFHGLAERYCRGLAELLARPSGAAPEDSAPPRPAVEERSGERLAGPSEDPGASPSEGPPHGRGEALRTRRRRPFASSTSSSSSSSTSSSDSAGPRQDATDPGDAGDGAAPPAAPPAFPEAVERACNELAAAGMPIHDRSTVARLGAQHPDVDLVEAAIRCANWDAGAGSSTHWPRCGRSPRATTRPAAERRAGAGPSSRRRRNEPNG